MANAKIGSYASWNGNFVENLSASKELGRGDSGKVFMIDQTTTFTVNLPKLSTTIAGWHCEFIIKTAAATVTYIMANGLTSAGGTTDDAETVILKQMGTTDSGSAAADSKDGVSFISGAVVADSVNVFTDGTSWYVTSICEDTEHVVAIDA